MKDCIQGYCIRKVENHYLKTSMREQDISCKSFRADLVPAISNLGLLFAVQGSKCLWKLYPGLGHTHIPGLGALPKETFMIFLLHTDDHLKNFILVNNWVFK